MQLFLKPLSRMTNSVNPDQNAPLGAVWSGSALSAYAILSDTLLYKILGHFPYFSMKICCGYSLEVPWQGSDEYHNICFCGEIIKYQNFSTSKGALSAATIWP